MSEEMGGPLHPDAPARAAFDPQRYLSKISGRDYLEVRWRLLWLRTEQPLAVIDTELVRDDGATATFRARVALPNGATATGWKQESAQDFGDYLEKAETGAIGRALAALGFGTQFALDLDEGPPQERPEPARSNSRGTTRPSPPAMGQPADQPAGQAPSPAASQAPSAASQATIPPSRLSTFWGRILPQKHYTHDDVDAACQAIYHATVGGLLSPQLDTFERLLLTCEIERGPDDAWRIKDGAVARI